MALATQVDRLDETYRAIRRAMRDRGRVLVAYSGGVDSALVARIAHDALGPDAFAVIADAESLARRDLEEAVREAAEIGIGLRVIRVSELASEQYVANPLNRCYFCRKVLGTALRPLAADLGFRTIADGVNVSDLGDYRPGIRAMDEEGFWHPLVEFGLTKPEVRVMAKDLGLSSWDKPSNACLSSRIAHGVPVTFEVLRQVEGAEEWLRDHGFRQVRVRHLGSTARIEVPPDDIARLKGLKPEASEALRAFGYADVVIDLRGYRSGSLNELLTVSPGTARTSPRPRPRP